MTQHRRSLPALVGVAMASAAVLAAAALPPWPARDARISTRQSVDLGASSIDMVSAVTAKGVTVSGAASPQSLPPGGVTTLSVTVKSAKPRTALVDLEVYDVTGRRVLQKIWKGQHLKAKSQVFKTSWTAPKVADTFRVAVGVFAPGWSSQLVWNNRTTTIQVKTKKALPKALTPASRHHVIRGALVDPQATAETKALMRYLSDQYGNHILSGQASLKDIEWLKTYTGKEPAVQKFDLEEYDNTSVKMRNKVLLGAPPKEDVIGEAIKWHARGGIVSLMVHWHAPDGSTKPGEAWNLSYFQDHTDFDLAKAMDSPTSQQYQDILRDIDGFATQLKLLKDDAGVPIPVIWRPLHEAEGSQMDNPPLPYFWWGTGGPGPAKALYKLMFDRMTKTDGVHNLIWEWNSSGSAWYPGNDATDMVSTDIYPKTEDHQTHKNKFDQLVTLTGDTKIVALSENSSIPDPAKLQAEQVDWSYFGTWFNMLTPTYNATDFVKSAYNSPYVLTLDELPKSTEMAVYP
jgi:hypothetical protein